MAQRLSCSVLLWSLLLLHAASNVQAQTQDNDTIVFTNAQYDSSRNIYKYEITINQNDLVNQTILTAVCRNQQNAITYSIPRSPGSIEHFNINPATGEVVLAVVAHTLVHDATYSAQIVCSASTMGGISRGQATLNVHYEVQNEFSPVIFPSTLVQLSYSEDYDISGENSIIYDFNATDRDLGMCGVVTFHLGSANADLFQIDPTTGALSFIRPLDFESKDQHTIVIIAENTDSLCTAPSPPTVQNTVNIRVNDTNDTPPRFSQRVYNASIREAVETPVPRFIISVPCVDPDTNSHLLYTLHDSHNIPFNIDSGGDVWVTDEIDYETNPSFMLTVSCRDLDGNEDQVDTAVINVTISPENEDRPIISPSHLVLTIDEFTPPGTKLVSPMSSSNASQTYNITDQDHGPHRDSYSFTMGVNPPKYADNFVVDNQSGELCLRKNVEKTYCGQDRKLRARIEIRITVCDIPNVETCQMLVITLYILARDCTAHFQQKQVNVSVSELTPTATEILSLPCQDYSNSTDKTVVILSSDRDSTDDVKIFSFDQETGALILVQSLDYETQQTHTLDLFCTNSYNTTASAQVVVEVLPENDNRPFFENPVYFLNITDDIQDVPHQIGQIRARDSDRGTGASLTYSLLSMTQYFTLEPNGLLFLSKTPPESRSVFVLKVSANDGDFTANTTLVITREITSSEIQETSSPPDDSLVLICVFAAILIFMVSLLLLSWIFICCLLHRHTKKKQYINGVYNSNRATTTGQNQSYCHYEIPIANQSVDCLAYNSAPFVNDPAFDGTKDPLAKEPEYEVLHCQQQQDSPKKSDADRVYTPLDKTKLVPQNSVDCYVKMESVVEDPQSPQDASFAKSTEVLGEESCNRCVSFGTSAGPNRKRAVLDNDAKWESSLEFGGSVETSLEFGATRGISLDFGGSSPTALSPRGGNGKSFRMSGGCDGHELECHELQEREKCLSCSGTDSKTKTTAVDDITNEHIH